MNMDLPYVFGCCLLAIVVCTAHLAAGFWCGLRFRGISEVASATVPPLPSAYLDQVFELVEGSQQLHSQIAEHVRDLPERVIIAAEKLLKVAKGLRRDIETQLDSERVSKAGMSRIIEPAHAQQSAARTVNKAQDHAGGPAIPRSQQPVGEPKAFVSASLSQGDFAKLAGPATYVSADHVMYERRPYAVNQFIAFCDGENPPADAFEQVLCRDISMNGVAFYLNRQPESDQLIITLGIAPGLSFMLVKVANYVPAVIHGQECYRIGCQFVRRLPNDSYSWDPKLQRIDAYADAPCVAAK